MGLLYARLHEDIYKRFLSKISENSWYLSESQRNSWKPWKTQLVIPHALAAFWKPNVLPSCESPRRPPPRWRLEHPDILSRDRPARQHEFAAVLKKANWRPGAQMKSRLRTKGTGKIGKFGK